MAHIPFLYFETRALADRSNLRGSSPEIQPHVLPIRDKWDQAFAKHRVVPFAQEGVIVLSWMLAQLEAPKCMARSSQISF